MARRLAGWRMIGRIDEVLEVADAAAFDALFNANVFFRPGIFGLKFGLIGCIGVANAGDDEGIGSSLRLWFVVDLENGLEGF